MKKYLTLTPHWATTRNLPTTLWLAGIVLITGYSASSTTSLKEHLTQYPVLYGRTYHNFNDSTYWSDSGKNWNYRKPAKRYDRGPNDEKMSDQLDIGSANVPW
jgi:hypothetical protein